VYKGIIFKDIFKDVKVLDNIVVVHLRLDDYNFQEEANIVSPSFYIEEIKKSKRKNVLIVVDKMRYLEEQKYINIILKGCEGCSFNIQQSDLLDDWNTLRCSSYTISSNSSFSWIACFFGMLSFKNSMYIYPNTGFYKEQKFDIEYNNFKSYNVKKINYMLI
jgi:hypothetical protein